MLGCEWLTEPLCINKDEENNNNIAFQDVLKRNNCLICQNYPKPIIPVARSLMVNNACLCFFPMTRSISKSPIIPMRYKILNFEVPLAS